MSSSPKNPKTRLLIVGAYGFLGQHVTNYFVNKDYHVHLAVKSSSKPPKSIINLNLLTSFTDQSSVFDLLNNQNYSNLKIYQFPLITNKKESLDRHNFHPTTSFQRSI